MQPSPCSQINMDDPIDADVVRRTLRFAVDIVDGRSLAGVELDIGHVWSTMYNALKPMPLLEREQRLAVVEAMLYGPTMH